jgi:hypothetical protein
MLCQISERQNKFLPNFHFRDHADSIIPLIRKKIKVNLGKNLGIFQTEVTPRSNNDWIRIKKKPYLDTHMSRFKINISNFGKE